MRIPKLKIITITSITTIAIAATVFAVNGTANKENEKKNETVSTSVYNTKSVTGATYNTPMNEEEIKSIMEKVEELNQDITVEALAKSYGKTEEELLAMKAEFETWEAVSLKLLSDMQNSKRLSNDKVLELYEQGYGVNDIEKAEELAVICDKTPEEILEIKGRTTDFNKRMAEEETTKQKGTTISKKDYKVRTWSEVTDTLGIDDRSIAEKVGMSLEDIEKMKSEGYSEHQINKIAIVAKNYNTDYKEVYGKVKNGADIIKLEKDYMKEKMNKATKPKREETLEEREQRYIKQLNISQDTVENCRENGLRHIDMVTVDALSKQYNVSADKIIEIRKAKKDWKEVSDELGGGKQ